MTPWVHSAGRAAPSALVVVIAIAGAPAAARADADARADSGYPAPRREIGIALRGGVDQAHGEQVGGIGAALQLARGFRRSQVFAEVAPLALPGGAWHTLSRVAVGGRWIAGQWTSDGSASIEGFLDASAGAKLFAGGAASVLLPSLAIGGGLQVRLPEDARGRRDRRAWTMMRLAIRIEPGLETTRPAVVCRGVCETRASESRFFVDLGVAL